MKRLLDTTRPRSSFSPERSGDAAPDPSGAEARLLRATIDLAPVGIAHLDRDGRYVLVNDRTCAMLGYSRDELLGRSFRDLLVPEDLPGTLDLLGQLAAGTIPCYTQEKRFVRRDGSVAWMRVTVSAVRGPDGGVERYVEVTDDVSAQRAAEEALRASEAKLRRIAESGLIGIFYWTRAGEITEANDTFCRMLGFSRDEVRAGALNWRSLTPPEWTTVGEAKEAEIVAHGVVTPWEWEFFTKDGRRVPVLVGGALLEGETDRGVAVCLDIGRRKAAELERERLLVLERGARAEAERASRLRDELLGIVAHDLRDPAHTIAMCASALLEIPLSESERARHLGIIQRAASGMGRLIADLLDVTRIESGTFTLRWAPVDVARLVDELIELHAQAAAARGIALRGEVAPGLPPVPGDHERLTAALSNLVGNALKFTPAGGHVVVRAGRADDRLLVSVEDSGCGIAAESLPYVFDRFWQARETRRGGAGLGLAIAKGILEAHGGTVWVESVVDRGSTFHLTLPLGGG